LDINRDEVHLVKITADQWSEKQVTESCDCIDVGCLSVIGTNASQQRIKAVRFIDCRNIKERLR